MDDVLGPFYCFSFCIQVTAYSVVALHTSTVAPWRYILPANFTLVYIFYFLHPSTIKTKTGGRVEGNGTAG